VLLPNQMEVIALPLTYLPILIVANDSQYTGDNTNGKGMNVLASVYLVIILAASLAAIPTLRVLGLVISPRTKSSFLGYERPGATAPVMLAALLRCRHRGTFLAPGTTWPVSDPTWSGCGPATPAIHPCYATRIDRHV